MEHQKKVDEYIAKHAQWTQALHLLREIIGRTDLQETVKWGGPVYTLEGKNVLGLGAFKSYVGIWFFQGALLSDPKKVLYNAQEGKTKAMRQWRFSLEEEISPKLVQAYIDEAIRNQREGKEIKPAAPSKKPLKIPVEMKQWLSENPRIDRQFNTLPLTRKREFTGYISEAKRPDTKKKRLEKIGKLILENKGLYHKYR